MGYWDEGKVEEAATASGDYWSAGTPVDPNAKLKAAQPDSTFKKFVRGSLEDVGKGANVVGQGIGAGLSMLSGAPTAESLKMKPLPQGRAAVQAAESDVMTPAAFMVGGGVGGALGNAPGAIAGAGAANVAVNQLESGINSYLYSDAVPPLDAPRPSTDPIMDKLFNRPYGNVQYQGTVGMLSEAGGRIVPSALAGLFGLNTATKEAQEAYAAQLADNAKELETAGTSSAEGLQTVARKKWELEQQARDTAKQRAESDYGKIAADKAKQAKEHQEALALAENKLRAHEEEEARAKLLGRTREETTAALTKQPVNPEPGVAIPSEAELERKMGFRNTIFDEADKTQQFYGRKYADFEKNYNDKIVPRRALATEVAPGSTLDVDQHGRLLDALNEIARRAAKKGEPMELSQPMQDLIKEAREVAGEPDVAGGQAGRRAFVDDKLGKPDPETGLVPLEEQKHAQGTTVDLLRQLAQRAQSVSKSLKSTAEKDMADLIHDSSYRSMEGAEGVPKTAIDDLRKTNTYYRDFRETFNNQFLQHVATNPEPTALYPDLVKNPARFNRLLTAADEPQKKVLQNAAADFYNDKGYTLQQIADDIGHNGIGKNMYGAHWDEAIGKLPKAETIVDQTKWQVANSSAHYKEFGNDFLNQYNKNRWDLFQKEKAEAMGVLKDMGPLGNQMRQEFKNAMTPEKLDAVGAKLANMSREDFVKALAATQRTPLQSAREAVMTGKPSDTIKALQRFTRFRSMFYTAALVGGATGGHVPPTMAGLAAITAAMGIPVVGEYAGRAVLRNPEIADMVASIATSGKSMNTLKFVAHRAADLIGAMASEKVKERMAKEPPIDNEK